MRRKPYALVHHELEQPGTHLVLWAERTAVDTRKARQELAVLRGSSVLRRRRDIRHAVVKLVLAVSARGQRVRYPARRSLVGE